MGLFYPNRAGFIESLKSVSVQEGASIFDGIRKVEVMPDIGGADTVSTNKRKPAGHVAGDIKIPGAFTLLYRSAIDYATKQPDFMYRLHSLQFTAEELPNFSKIALVGVRFLGWPFSAEGTDAIEIEMKFNCMDILVAVGDGELVSLIPEANEQTA